MAQIKSARLVPAATFDSTRCRHQSDGRTLVLFSHHYATLCARLAEEATIFDGTEILRRTAERTFLPILREVLGRPAMSEGEGEGTEACRAYWAWCGMGDLHFVHWAPDGGRVQMRRSHLDEGWLRSRGGRRQPVSYLTQGFLAAAWAAMAGQPEGTYRVRETESLVSGAVTSVFLVERR